MATTRRQRSLHYWASATKRRVAMAGVVALGATFAVGTQQSASSAPIKPVITTQWLQYHGDAVGSGVAVGITAVRTSTRRWTSPTLDGEIYGEPLVYKNEVIVATENNSIYALSAMTGAILWTRHVAAAVPSNELPCGDISPTVGITGTPVIDSLRHEVFAVALEMSAGKAEHYMYGLNVNNGATMARVFLPTGTPHESQGGAPYLQRSALALDDGSVIFTMGGNYGDCPLYHGEVGAVNESGHGGTPAVFVVDSGPGESQGAVWMGGGAPAVDAAGHVWVETGNGSQTSPRGAYDDSDGVLELTATMHLKAFFAPTTWASDNAHDADLSDTPALTSNGQVVATGKSGMVYLLNATHLGGIGGQEAEVNSDCGNDLDGGVTIHGNIVYLPCLSGPVAVRVGTAPASLKVIWRAQVGGGPPILAAQRIWTIGQNGVLYGLNPNTGAVMQQASIGTPANHFPTPSVGAGLLLAANANQVVAFSAH